MVSTPDRAAEAILDAGLRRRPERYVPRGYALFACARMLMPGLVRRIDQRRARRGPHDEDRRRTGRNDRRGVARRAVIERQARGPRADQPASAPARARARAAAIRWMQDSEGLSASRTNNSLITRRRGAGSTFLGRATPVRATLGPPMGSNRVLRVYEAADLERPFPTARIIDNATIVPYNSDSGHRIRGPQVRAEPLSRD